MPIPRRADCNTCEMTVPRGRISLLVSASGSFTRWLIRRLANMLACVLAAGVVLGGVLPRPAGAAPAAETDASNGQADFERILMERDEVPVTDPTEGPPPQKRVDLSGLDGTVIADRRCRIERDEASGWSLVTFEPTPSLPLPRPRWALPNELLEKIESVIAENPDRAYRVSGETTVYRNQVFLVLRKVTIEANPRGAGGAKPPAEAEAVAAASRPTTKAAATNPARKPASARDVLKSLLADRPGTPVIAPVVQPDQKLKAAPSVAPVGNAEVLFTAYGKMVANRTVRLLLAGVGVWKEARFEADNTLREPPIRLLPCRMLERAERFGSAGTVKLRITGEITHYRGRRYLLLRKHFRVRDMGQF